MKRFDIRTIAVFLTLIMLVAMLPMTVLAAAADSFGETINRELLDALTENSGSEEKGEDYYRLLQQYGLLDKKGNPIDSWSIQKDGRDVTIDEIREILKGDYDPKDCVWVDGSPVTLEDLNTMIEIEDYLAHLLFLSNKLWYSVNSPKNEKAHRIRRYNS